MTDDELSELQHFADNPERWTKRELCDRLVKATRALLDARKALEAVPHLRRDARTGLALAGDYHGIFHSPDECAEFGGACNARRVLIGKEE